MDEGTDSRVDASGQGVQVGDNNVQVNYHGAPPALDPETLGALSPQAAVVRLRAMSRDAVVNLFAKAAPGDVTDVLRVLSGAEGADRDLAVAVLADMRPLKAGGLIAPLAQEFPWLESVQKAVADIGALAATIKWTDPSPAGAREGSLYGRPSIWLFRSYSQGRIFWSDHWDKGGRAYLLHAGIGEYFTDPEMAESLGYPVSDPNRVRSGSSGAEGVVQRFAGGLVYSWEQGVYRVEGDICERYNEFDDEEGWLGFPVAEAAAEDGRWGQRFEGGAVYRNVNKEMAFAVPAALLGQVGEGWFPSWPHDEAAAPLYSTDGIFQEFGNLAGGRKIIYSSAQGAHGVEGSVLDSYLTAGGPGSWLGFPVHDEWRWEGGGEVTVGQVFQGGEIYGRPELGLFGVVQETIDLLREILGSTARIGFPVAEEQSIGTAGDRIQFFERGNVTARNEVREIYLRQLRQWPVIQAEPEAPPSRA
jgi:hypothetical protein